MQSRQYIAIDLKSFTLQWNVSSGDLIRLTHVSSWLMHRAQKRRYALPYLRH